MAQATMEQMEQAAREIWKRPYTQIITRDGDGFSGEILEFPGCIAYGDARKELDENLENAALAWIMSELDNGRKIAPPLKHHEASGAYLWRPPRSTHARAIVAAALENVSLNSFITTAVSEKIGQLAATQHMTQVDKAITRIEARFRVEHNRVIDETWSAGEGTPMSGFGRTWETKESVPEETSVGSMR